MAQFWWKRKKTVRHPFIKYACEVRLVKGDLMILNKGTFISPIRQAYLHHGHPFKGTSCEVQFMVADTPYGLALVPVDSVEW
jgi:hypothetical protein